MKKHVVILGLLASLFAGCSKEQTDQAKQTAATAADKTKEAAITVADKTKAMAIDAKDAISDKLVEWKLTPSDIKADLEKGGRVVRSKSADASARAGVMFDNAKTVTVINAKLVGDSQLSALKINVDANQGVVTLTGTVKSAELIGRAVGLALDTDGVTQVISLLTVASP